MPAAKDAEIVERHYSPSTRESFACYRSGPMDGLEAWLEIHPDAIRLIPEINRVEFYSLDRLVPRISKTT